MSLEEALARRQVVPGPASALSRSHAEDYKQVLKGKRKGGGLRVPDLMAAAAGGLLNVANLSMLAPAPADETSREAEIVRSSHTSTLRVAAFPSLWPNSA